MISAEHILQSVVKKGLTELYNLNDIAISFQKTRKEFEGDFTLVTFAYTKETKRSPEQIGEELGYYLIANEPQVFAFNVVKGFLNISLKDDFWLNYFNSIKNNLNIGLKNANSNGRTVMLEYSSPNTNKPLHLGHVRNNLVGYSVAQILKANGNTVIKANIINDRGIHICKSMLAWQKWGNGETPESSGLKGDHLVGKYYVEYDKWYKAELEYAKKLSDDVFQNIEERNRRKPVKNKDSELALIAVVVGIVLITAAVYWVFKNKKKKVELTEEQKDILASGDPEEIKNIIPKENDLEERDLLKELKNITETDKEKINKYKLTANKKADYEKFYEEIKNRLEPVKEVQEMLLKWEAGDKEVINLWKKMNGWVYDGFAVTYKSLGVDFDKMYYESNTYLLGKELVQEGLQKNVFYKKENGSVAIDLTAEGLDEKIVLRSDGTSVYITQDIGTAIERFKEFPKLNQLIYTVGNEQDYHFKVLFKILEKLGYQWAKECYHLSYGMVELPEGKMKSREGTVVDADDLIEEMFNTAKQTTEELGKVDNFTQEELQELYRTISMGALKYFILKVDPKKKMLFDPKESIDFNGHTGPFIQYTYARIKSVLRKAEINFDTELPTVKFNSVEKELIKLIYDFEGAVEESAKLYNPSIVANYVYELTKLYNRFYHEFTILKEEDETVKKFRLQLSSTCAQAICNAMNLLGINVPERM